jgi:hypothetical protein
MSLLFVITKIYNLLVSIHDSCVDHKQEELMSIINIVQKRKESLPEYNTIIDLEYPDNSDVDDAKALIQSKKTGELFYVIGSTNLKTVIRVNNNLRKRLNQIKQINYPMSLSSTLYIKISNNFIPYLPNVLTNIVASYTSFTCIIIVYLNDLLKQTITVREIIKYGYFIENQEYHIQQHVYKICNRINFNQMHKKITCLGYLPNTSNVLIFYAPNIFELI